MSNNDVSTQSYGAGPSYGRYKYRKDRDRIRRFIPGQDDPRNAFGSAQVELQRKTLVNIKIEPESSQDEYVTEQKMSIYQTLIESNQASQYLLTEWNNANEPNDDVIIRNNEEGYTEETIVQEVVMPILQELPEAPMLQTGLEEPVKVDDGETKTVKPVVKKRCRKDYTTLPTRVSTRIKKPRVLFSM